MEGEEKFCHLRKGGDLNQFHNDGVDKRSISECLRSLLAPLVCVIIFLR